MGIFEFILIALQYIGWSYCWRMQMIIKWKPFWYELDWPIVVGDVDWFDVKNDGYFYNGVLSKEQRKDFSFMKIEIERIIHPVLGEVKGIITFGLDYTIYLANGEIIEVNCFSFNFTHFVNSLSSATCWCYNN